MQDSIQIIRDTVVVTNPNLLDIVTQIDGFYTNAWGRYTTIFGVVSLLLGVIIPLIQTNRLERKMNKQDDNLKDLLDKIEKSKTELKDLKQRFEEEHKDDLLFAKDLRLRVKLLNEKVEVLDNDPLGLSPPGEVAEKAALNTYKSTTDLYDSLFKERKRDTK